MAFDQTKYNNDYKREKYDRISLLVPKGKKAVLQEWASSLEKSLNAAIIECVAKQTGFDLSQD